MILKYIVYSLVRANLFFMVYDLIFNFEKSYLDKDIKNCDANTMYGKNSVLYIFLYFMWKHFMHKIYGRFIKGDHQG